MATHGASPMDQVYASAAGRTPDPAGMSDDALEALQWVTSQYYLKEANFLNGLIRDKTAPGAPASIAAVGMSLAASPLAVERGGLPRDYVARRVLVRLRFFRDSPQGPGPDVTGYKGFYYHFL